MNENNEKKTLEKAKQIVKEAFSSIPEVIDISVSRWRKQINFHVFLNMPRYDTGLIDKCLDIEYELLQYAEDGFLWDFIYSPLCKLEFDSTSQSYPRKDQENDIRTIA